jgi:hypothetical protein
VDLADVKSPLLQAFQHMVIQISIPLGNKDISLHAFSILSLYHCKLTTLIKEAFESPLLLIFHLTPFKMYHVQPDGMGNKCIFSKM